MLVIAAYIAILCLTKLILSMIPLDEENKKLIMRAMGCFATVFVILFHYKQSGITESVLPPLSPKLSAMSKSDSFSGAAAAETN